MHEETCLHGERAPTSTVAPATPASQPAVLVVGIAEVLIDALLSTLRSSHRPKPGERATIRQGDAQP
jgi:hypothetical protein